MPAYPVTCIKAVSANPIKNGTIVLFRPPAAWSNVQLTKDYGVVNTPVLADIEQKYINRFDDINYYTA